MLAEMPDELLREWRAYDIIEPFGQEANHRLFSLIVSACSWGKVSPEEVAPWLHQEPPPEATPQEVMAMAMAAMGGNRHVDR